MEHVQRLFSGRTPNQLGALRSQLIEQHRVELALFEAAKGAEALHPVTKDLYQSRLTALGELIAEANARMLADVVDPTS